MFQYNIRYVWRQCLSTAFTRLSFNSAKTFLRTDFFLSLPSSMVSFFSLRFFFLSMLTSRAIRPTIRRLSNEHFAILSAFSENRCATAGMTTTRRRRSASELIENDGRSAVAASSRMCSHGRFFDAMLFATPRRSLASLRTWQPQRDLRSTHC